MNKVIRDPFTCNLPHLDIHGETKATSIAPINAFIKDNIKLRNKKVIIVHGKGTGALRKQTHETLKKHPQVAKYYIDGLNDGQTIVELII